MSQNNNSNSLIFTVLLLAAAMVFLWPLAGGCNFKPPGGAEISSWWGKVKVKPLPPEPPLVAPATRCLIFSASWCTPCRKLKVTVAGMARSGWRVGPLATDDIEVIDVDGRDERIKKYHRGGVPDLVIVDQSGKEVGRKAGEQSANDLAAWIRSTRQPTSEETDGR